MIASRRRKPCAAVSKMQNAGLRVRVLFWVERSGAPANWHCRAPGAEYGLRIWCVSGRWNAVGKTRSCCNRPGELRHLRAVRRARTVAARAGRAKVECDRQVRRVQGAHCHLRKSSDTQMHIRECTRNRTEPGMRLGNIGRDAGLKSRTAIFRKGEGGAHAAAIGNRMEATVNKTLF